MPLGLRLARRGQLAQCFAHARRAPGQCAKPSPGKVSRTLHAVFSRTWSARTFRRSELCADGTQPGTHHRYALMEYAHGKISPRLAHNHLDKRFLFGMCSLRGEAVPEALRGAFAKLP
jgi:hypothetical protein